VGEILAREPDLHDPQRPDLEPVPAGWLLLVEQRLLVVRVVPSGRVSSEPFPDLRGRALNRRLPASLPRRQWLAIGDVWGPDRVPESRGFHPHVSLVYSNSSGPSANVIELMDGVRPAPARVTVHALSLIVLDRDERLYRWSTYATVPLGRGAAVV
jgi:hypothetical protein